MGELSGAGPEVGIIGGLGRMGQWFARSLQEAGRRVHIADEKLGTVSQDFVAGSDILILAVPYSAVEAVLRRVGPWTREDGLVIDLTSLKEAPVRWMLGHCRGEVVGCHPLFGPSAPSMDGETVFLCPARSGRWAHWLRAFLKARGAIIVELDPAGHDRLMSRVQVLRHFLLACFGLTLMELEFDPVADPSLCGRPFKTLMDLLVSQFQQPSSLYVDLAQHNTSTEEVLGAFLRSTDRMAGSLMWKDRRGAVHLLDQIREYLSPSAGTSRPPFDSEATPSPGSTVSGRTPLRSPSPERRHSCKPGRPRRRAAR